MSFDSPPNEERNGALATARELYQKIQVIYQAHRFLPDRIGVPDEVLELLKSTQKELDDLRNEFLLSVDEIELASPSMPSEPFEKANLLFRYLTAKAFKTEEDAEAFESNGWERVATLSSPTTINPNLEKVRAALEQLNRINATSKGTYFCIAYSNFEIGEICLMKRKVDSEKIATLPPMAMAVAEEYGIPPDEITAAVFYSDRSYTKMRVYGYQQPEFEAFLHRQHVKNLSFESLPWSELKSVPKRGIIDAATAFRLPGKVLFVNGDFPA